MLKSPSENAAPSAPNTDKMEYHILLAQESRDLKALREKQALRETGDFQDYQEEMEFQELPAEMVQPVHLAFPEQLAETSSHK